MQSLNTPLISIIIPVYNTERYLSRCLNSIVEQTYKNIEIIIVDDGSTDGSRKILDEYAEQDKRFRVIHKNNEGVATARNLAINVASGDFIGFIDSDDYVSPFYLEKLLEGFTDESIDMVTCGFYYAYDNKTEQIKNKQKVPNSPMILDEMFQYMYERDVYRGVSGYLWTRLTRMSIVKQDGRQVLFFRTDLDTTDDIFFVAELMCRINRVRYLEDSLYYYYQRQFSIVHNDAKNLETLVWLKSWEETLFLYEQRGVPCEKLNYIKRLYVYRCGKLLEVAEKYKDEEKKRVLKEKIYPFLQVYEKMNSNKPDFIAWIHDLLDK